MSEENKKEVLKKDTRAWGYNAKGESKIFEDGKLPQGWEDSPAKFEKPDQK